MKRVGAGLVVALALGACGGGDQPASGTAAAAVARDAASDRCDFMVLPIPGEPFGRVVRGTPGDDVLVGTPGADVILGLGGDDEIRGEGGEDLLCGGPGADRIRGGDGNDAILAGSGDDEIFGEDGDDELLSTCGGRDRGDGGAGADILVFGEEDSVPRGEGDDVVRGEQFIDGRAVHRQIGERQNRQRAVFRPIEFFPIGCIGRDDPPQLPPTLDEPAPPSPAPTSPAGFLTYGQLPRGLYGSTWGEPLPAERRDDTRFACDGLREALPGAQTRRSVNGTQGKPAEVRGNRHVASVDQFVAEVADVREAVQRLRGVLDGCARPGTRVLDYAAPDGLRIVGLFTPTEQNGETVFRNVLVAIGGAGGRVTVVVLDGGDRPAPLAEFKDTARAAVQALEQR